MSRHVGAKEVFSVEYELDPAVAQDQRWLYGHMCFWVRGNMVGEYEEIATLNVALAVLPELLGNHGKRFDPILFSAPVEEAFSKIFSPLCIDSGQPDDQVARDEELYSRFTAVARGIDIFDNWDAFLIEDQFTGRFLFRRVNSEVREAKIPAGEFDRVLAEFLKTLQAETDARIARRTPER